MSTRPAHFVFIHGAWHGSWCFDAVAAALVAKGHTVEAIDLPGRDDPVEAANLTLADLVDPVIAIAMSAPQPPILVGHSFGGIVATHVASAVPASLARLVYLGAFVPTSGQSLLDLAAIPEFTSSLVTLRQIVDFERGVYAIPQEHAREVLYHLATEESALDAARRLNWEGLAPAAEQRPLHADTLASVPTSYIELLQDRAIPLQAQRAMSLAAGIDDIHTLDADHSPFLSRKDELVNILDQIAIATVSSASGVDEEGGHAY